MRALVEHVITRFDAPGQLITDCLCSQAIFGWIVDVLSDETIRCYSTRSLHYCYDLISYFNKLEQVRLRKTEL